MSSWRLFYGLISIASSLWTHHTSYIIQLAVAELHHASFDLQAFIIRVLKNQKSFEVLSYNSLGPYEL